MSRCLVLLKYRFKISYLSYQVDILVNMMQIDGLYNETITKLVHFFCIHLKVYGKGTKIDGIRETATIAISFDISRFNVVISFKFSEHGRHTLHNKWVKFQWYHKKKLNYVLLSFTKLRDKAYFTFMIFRFTGFPNVIVCRIKSTQ